MSKPERSPKEIKELEQSELLSRVTLPSDSLTLGQIRQNPSADTILMTRYAGEGLNDRLKDERKLAYFFYEKALHGSKHMIRVPGNEGRLCYGEGDTTGECVKNGSIQVAQNYVELGMAKGKSAASELIRQLERDVHRVVKEVHGIEPNPR